MLSAVGVALIGFAMGYVIGIRAERRTAAHVTRILRGLEPQPFVRPSERQ